MDGDTVAAGSVTVSRADGLDDGQMDPTHAEPVPLKNRVALYQAAVSRQDRPDSSSGVMEEAEVCSPPGGLASIRRQFENEDVSTAHTLAQFHLKHRSVQAVSHSSVMSMVSSSGGRQVSPQDERAAHDQIIHQEVVSSYENHNNESEDEEYYPRLSTKELAQHFEKTIEEAAPSKKIKIRVPKSEMCAVCKKRVYPMDGLIADKRKFHKSCFFCEYCKTKLSLGNFVSLRGHLYCQPHYKQLFKSKGNFEEGFGQGSQRDLMATRNASDWRCSLSQSSICSLDTLEKTANKPDENLNQNPSKMSVVWPPQSSSSRNARDGILVKPVWPPKSETSKSLKYQRRKASERGTL